MLPAGSGLYLVGETGMALGSPSTGTMGNVWQDVHAVLDCRQAPADIAGANDAGVMHLPIKDAKHDRHGLQSSLPAALSFVSHHLQQKRRVLLKCSGGEALFASLCVRACMYYSQLYQTLCCLQWNLHAHGVSGAGQHNLSVSARHVHAQAMTSASASQ